MSETINWSHHDLNGLEELYWDEIAPALRRDGRDPTPDRHTRRSLTTATAASPTLSANTTI